MKRKRKYKKEDKEIEAAAQKINVDVEQQSDTQLAAQLQAWREKGPAGKMRNIALQANLTPQSRAAFEQVEKVVKGAGEDKAITLYMLVKDS